MSLRVNLDTAASTLHRAESFVEAKFDNGVIVAQKGTVSDITKIIEDLGIDSRGDIIFNGMDQVAIQQVSPNRPPYYSREAKVILKITKNADSGIHPLMVTGLCNEPGKFGQWKNIQLEARVQDT